MVPLLVRETGPKATGLFLEFFKVPFENCNTRQAYLQAVRQFLSRCESRGVGDLTQIGSLMLTAYREQHSGSPTTVKRFLRFHGKGRPARIGPAEDRA